MYSWIGFEMKFDSLFVIDARKFRLSWRACCSGLNSIVEDRFIVGNDEKGYFALSASSIDDDDDDDDIRLSVER